MSNQNANSLTAQDMRDIYDASVTAGPYASSAISTKGAVQPQGDLSKISALPYGVATNLSPTFAQNDPRHSADQAQETNTEENENAITFWSKQPGFENAHELLNPENKLQEHELHNNRLFVEQAQQFLKYNEGLYSNGKEDLSGASKSTLALLKPFDQLTQDEKKELVSEATWGAGWISNNIGSTGLAFKRLTGDDVPAHLKQAALFMMDTTDNLKMSWSNIDNMAGRFVVQGILTDPISIGSIILGAVSFGTGTAAVQGAALAAKQAGKTALRSIVQNSAREAVEKTLQNAAVKTVAKGAAIGVAYGAADSALQQGIKTSEFKNNAGQTVTRQNEFSWGQFGAQAAFGGVFGGALSGTGYLGAKLWKQYDVSGKISRTFNKSSETTTVAPSARTPRQHIEQVDTELNKNLIANGLNDAELQELRPLLKTLTDPQNAESLQGLARQLGQKSTRLASDGEQAANKIKVDADVKQQLEEGKITEDQVEETTRLLLAEANQIEIPKASILQAALQDGFNVNIKDLPETVQARLVDTDNFIKPLQEFAFGREVDRAIKSSDTNFNFAQTRQQYAAIDDNAVILNSKADQYRSFTSNFDNILNGIDSQYNRLRKTDPSKLNSDEKAFVDQYHKTFGEGDKNVTAQSPRKANGQADADETAYTALKQRYIDIRGAIVPKQDKGFSWNTAGFYALAQNSKMISFKDALRLNPFNPEHVPVDSISNIKRAIKSIDTVFAKAHPNSKGDNGSFIQKIDALEKEIKKTASKDAYTAEAKKNEIQGAISEFRKQNEDHLQKMSEDIALIQEAIKSWETKKDNGGIDYMTAAAKKLGLSNTEEKMRAGWFKSITAEQKDALQLYASDMQKIVTELKKGNFGEEGNHLDSLKTPGELSNFLSRISAHTSMAHMRLTDKIFNADPKVKQDTSMIQVRDSIARGIEMGYYSTHRRTVENPNSKGNWSIPVDPGNSESLLDKSTLALAETLAKADTWTVPQRGQVAGIIAPLIRNNMMAEALYNVREFRWRLDNVPGDKWQADWVNDLKTLLKDDMHDPYVRNAVAKIEHISSPENRKGGGMPGFFGSDNLLLDGTGGGRWVEDLWIKATFQPRLANRMKGDERLTLKSIGNMKFGVSTPTRFAIKENFVKNPTLAATSFLKGDLLVKNKETGAWEYKSYAALKGQDMADIEYKGVIAKTITKIPVLKGLYGTSALAQAARVPLRFMFAPEAAAIGLVKNTYGFVGNTGVMAAGALTAAGAIDVAQSEIFGTDQLGVLPVATDIALLPIDIAMQAMAVSSDFKREHIPFIEEGGITDYVFTAKAANVAWDFTSDFLSDNVENRLSSTGEFSIYDNLLNITQPDDINDRFIAFARFMDSLDQEIAAAPEKTRLGLMALKQSEVKIGERFQSILETREIATNELALATQNYNAELEKSNLALSESERLEHSEKLAALKAIKSEKNNNLSDINKDAKLFAISLERMAHSQLYIKQHENELTDLKQQNLSTTPDQAEINEQRIKELENLIGKHIEKRSPSLAYLVGADAVAELKMQQEKAQQNSAQTPLTPEQQQAATDKAAADKAAADKAAADKAAADEAARQAAAKENAQKALNTNPFQAKPAKQSPVQQPANNKNSNAIQPNVSDVFNNFLGMDATGAASAFAGDAGSFIKNTFNMVTESKSPLVGGAMALGIGWLALNMFTGDKNGPGMFSGLMSSLGKIAVFAIPAAIAWGFLKNGPAGSNEAPETASETKTPRYNNVVPFVGQSQGNGHAPSGAFISRTTTDHSGQKLTNHADQVEQYAHSGSNNFAPADLTAANDSIYNSANSAIAISSVNHGTDTAANPLTDRTQLPNGVLTAGLDVA